MTAKTMYPDLDIDLTFQPVVCENPRRFTREQIAHYNEHGYITRVTLFEGEVLRRVQDFFRRSKKELTTYASAQLVPTLGRKKWAVLCSGKDPHNRWEVHPRPGR